MKIIFPFSGVGAIFFPVGKLEAGGTCEFATDKCLINCAAKRNTKKSAKPGEFGYILGYEKKKDTLNCITENPPLLAASVILKNMEEIKTKILYWFASGDCSEKNTDRIAGVMKHLSLEGIYQCGFTRNEKLWWKTKEIDDVTLALTVENRKEINRISSEGLFAIPDYSTGRVELKYGRYTSGGSCGGSRYNIKGIDYEANCQLCFDNKRGCFTDYD